MRSFNADPQTDAQLLESLSVAELVDLTGCHAATARRWRVNGTLPPPVGRLLRILANRLLGSPGWLGWQIINGELVSPENWRYSAGEVLALTFLRAQLANSETQLRTMRGLDAQPEPGEIPLKIIRNCY